MKTRVSTLVLSAAVRYECIGGAVVLLVLVGENSLEFCIDEPCSLLGGTDPGILLPHLGSSTLLHCSCIWMRGTGAGLRGWDGSGRLCAGKTKPPFLLFEAQCPPNVPLV